MFDQVLTVIGKVGTNKCSSNTASKNPGDGFAFMGFCSAVHGGKTVVVTEAVKDADTRTGGAE